MRPLSARTITILVFDLVVALLGVINIPTVVVRPSVPFTAVLAGTSVTVDNVRETMGPSQVVPGDVILAWEDIPILSLGQLELLADRSRIGHTVLMAIERSGVHKVVPVTLAPFYTSMRFPLIMAMTGLIVLAFSLVLVLKRPEDPAALALHLTLACVSGLVLHTQGALEAGSIASITHRSGLFILYNFSAAGFFVFTTLFPVRRFGPPLIRVVVLVLISLMFGGALSWRFAGALAEGSARAVDAFLDLYELFHRWFLVLLATGFALLVVGYRSEVRPEQRAALRWILWGTLIGCTPFLVVVVYPQSIGAPDLLPEEVSVLFTLAIPLSFTVAFLRYHVFRIEIERYHRLTTRLVALLTSAIQAAIALTAVSLVDEYGVFREGLGVAVSLVVIVLLLNPVRRRLQRILEESLFPARFSGTSILRRAATLFHSALSVQDLGLQLIREIHSSIPGLEFHWYEFRDGVLETFSATAGKAPLRVGVPHSVLNELHRHRLLARRGTAHSAPPVNGGCHDWLVVHGFDFALSLTSDNGTLLGIACGRLLATREPLAAEEVEVLLGVRSEARNAVDRLHLQEAVIIEQQERRKSEKLSQLKSHFVSSVSHDLRTPLTSIQMFAEMLQDPRMPSRRRREYLRIIEQESARLGRLVDNVLDFAKVERGVKEYRLQKTDPRKIVRAALDAMRMQFESEKASVRTVISKRAPDILADQDALEEALVNLLSNALKYSRPPKRIVVSLKRRGDDLEFTVADRGVGIPPESVQKVFDPFYRVRDEKTAQVGGVGLGLPLVKHITEGHGGTVSIASEAAKGTSVTIRIPISARNRSGEPAP